MEASSASSSLIASLISGATNPLNAFSDTAEILEISSSLVSTWSLISYLTSVSVSDSSSLPAGG